MSSKRITTIGYGENPQYAKYSNKTAKGRRKNRRAVIRLDENNQEKIEIIEPVIEKQEEVKPIVETIVQPSTFHTPINNYQEKPKQCVKRGVVFSGVACAIGIGACEIAKNEIIKASSEEGSNWRLVLNLIGDQLCSMGTNYFLKEPYGLQEASVTTAKTLIKENVKEASIPIIIEEVYSCTTALSSQEICY